MGGDSSRGRGGEDEERGTVGEGACGWL